MRAAVFCNFPENLSQRLREQLEEWGIEIRHFGSISSGTEMKDPEVELVVAFIELMSHGQSDQTKALAKRWNARWVPLSRKVASWVKHLPPPKKPVLVASQAALPLTADVNAFAGEPGIVDWGANGVPSDFKPAVEVPESAPASLSTPDQQWEEIRELFAGEVEELKAKIETLSKENHDLKLKVERSQLTETELYDLASDEEKRLKARISQIEGELEKLRSTSLEALGHAIRTLVSAGLLEEREAADRLLNLVLGRKR